MRYESCERYICTIGDMLLRDDASFQEGLKNVVDFLAHTFRIAKCSIMIVDHAGVTMEVIASTNPAILGLKRNLSDISISTMALMEGRPFHGDSKTRSCLPLLEQSEYTADFSLSIPIVYIDKKLGVVNFTDSEDGKPFTKDQESLLTEIVVHLSPYVYSAHAREGSSIYIGKLKEKNEQLLRLDELKTNLTNFIVHDLKGPISTIIANLDMLSYEPLTDQQFEYLNIAIEDTYKMQRMVLNILGVMKMEEAKITIMREEVDIRELAEREIASFRTTLSRRNIELVLDGEQHRCYIDENLIGRAISNLLLNAVEHTPDNSSIAVVIRHDPQKSETTVTVADQGAGISDALREKIFDKFFQAEEGRAQRKTTTGLGLTFCKLVVTAHGGTIWVEDSPNKGARFVFTLPEFIHH